MIRIILVALFCLLSSLYGFSQKKKSVVQNNIKSVAAYEQTNPSKADRGVKIEETIFDLNGNVVEEFEFENGKEVSHTKYEYDDYEKKLKEIKINAQGRVVRSTLFEYNDEDQRLKEIESDASGKVVKIIEYKYDGDLRTEKVVSDGNKVVKSKKSYTYTTH